MTAADLIAYLQTVPPDAEIKVLSVDNDSWVDCCEHEFALWDIDCPVVMLGGS